MTIQKDILNTWPMALAALCMWCEEADASLRFGYHHGWFIKPNSDTPYLDKERKGYTIEVGLQSYANKDGTEVFYEKPSHAVHAGIKLLKAVLKEQIADKEN